MKRKAKVPIATGNYRVTVEEQGCRECGSHGIYRVARPDGSTLSIDFDVQDDAIDIALALNEAYKAGRKASSESK